MTGLALGVGVAAGLGLAVVLFLFLNQFLKLAFRKKYKVHPTGAVVVTGASTGIGNHAARHLAKQYTVYATVRKQKDVDALNKLGLPNLRPVIMDVAKPVRACVERLVFGWGAGRGVGAASDVDGMALVTWILMARLTIRHRKHTHCFSSMAPGGSGGRRSEDPEGAGGEQDAAGGPREQRGHRPDLPRGVSQAHGRAVHVRCKSVRPWAPERVGA